MKLSASNVIAAWVLGIDTVVSAATLYLMWLCVVSGFTGALYPLTALITFCQVTTAAVLTAVMSKKKVENSSGGITYEAAMANIKSANPDRDC